ncbi:uncharacterized protein RHO25_011609 [Cercospora beticola]|uniref:Extracellular membrane protein CFEM domain-containing protein n=1 Tax=Cercospora beticola TaxID=122368 RepID=A0ABZ0P604_CERBT|nr:hypothetical protein RHO25_011609 [Cercospora beticola]CAK1366875.1 unnamed protein product [Cercospora beticola]
MHASLAFTLALAAFAVADTTGCGDTVDNAIDTCLSPAVDAYNRCPTSDRGCRCGRANAVVGCYGACTVASGRPDWVNTAIEECRGINTTETSSTETTEDTSTTTPTGQSTSTATAAPSTTPDADESSATVVGVALPGCLAAFFGFLAFM